MAPLASWNWSSARTWPSSRTPPPAISISRRSESAMEAFSGFPGGKVRFSRIPSPFFKELLPLIDNLNELKVTLYALWKLDRMEGEHRYLQLEDFSEDTLFVEGMAENAKESH